jgi:hypothetical protein
VTGVGLVSALGIGTEETWSALRAGKSGIRRITQFDCTNFACQIAGEVKDFDPLIWIDKKEVKKMGRFIQVGIAASEFAMEMAKLKIAPEDAEMAGVYIGSGIGSTGLGWSVGQAESLPSSFQPRSSIWHPGMCRFEPGPRDRTPPPQPLVPPVLTPSAIPTRSFSAATPMS